MTTRLGKPASRARLTRLYEEWQQAQFRLNMALQTLNGAHADVLERETTFKSAARLAFGSDATFEYENGKLRFQVPQSQVQRVVKRPAGK